MKKNTSRSGFRGMPMQEGSVDVSYTYDTLHNIADNSQ